MNQLRNLQANYSNSTSNDDPTHEYIDAIITNNTTIGATAAASNTTPTIEPIPVVFNQIKTSNIIDDCSQYYLSVIRWSVETSLPIIIPTMQIGTSPESQATGDTEYYVNMIFKKTVSGNPGYNIPTYSNFNSVLAKQITINGFLTDNTVTQPKNPQTVQEYMNNPYYYLDSVQSFLDTINDKYDVLFTALKAANSELSQEVAPRFIWDPQSGKIVLSVSKYFVRGFGASGDTLYMSMSTNLYNLLNTFSTVRINSNPTLSDTGADYVFNLTSLNGINTSSFATSGTNIIPMYNYYQESSSVPSWSPVSSIVFVTNSIPVNATHSGTPQFQGGSNLGTQVGSSLSQNATTSVLTDFEIPMETGVEYRNISYYSPTSEYRLFDFVSNQQLNNLNISIFWKDKYGQLHPLTLRQNASATIKLLLRKKDFNGV